MIDPTLLSIALDGLNFKPQIYLFASRLNRQFPIYCSFKPDPDAFYIDAFTLSPSDKHFYCFPPFSCVLQVLQKIIQDKATGIMVVPMWPTQSWYPILTSLLVLPPITLPPSKYLLSLPAFPEENHPLHRKMKCSYLSTIRQQLEGLGFTSRSIAVIVASWREGTTSQYQTYLQKWLEFCKQKHCDVLSPPLPLTLEIFCLCCTRRAYLTALSTRLEVCCHQFYNSTLIPLFHLVNYLLSDGL